MMLALYFMLLCCSCKTPPLPDPFPTTTTTTVPPVEGNEPERVSTAEGVVLWKNLQENCKINSWSLDASGFSASYTESVAWPTVDGQTDGYICAVWLHLGETIAAYWDGKAVQSPYKYVSLFHFTNEDSALHDVQPHTGQDIGFFFVSQQNKYRSNIVWGKWPLENEE